MAVDFVYDPQLSGPMAATLRERVYEGVQTGTGAAGLPIPDGGIGIQVSGLQIAPLPDTGFSNEAVEQLGRAIEVLTAQVTAALWTGIRELNGSAA